MAKELESILEDKRRKREKPTPSRTPEEICRLASWPSDKPIAEIVFPYSFRTTKEILATLWVMLKKEEIQKRLFCTRYNQFLFLPAPHPTVLWITVLYNRVHGPRWLTYYLDLKSLQGQQTARLLGQAKQYRLLFFAKEEPQRCVDIQLLAIAPAQCRMLLEWATIAQMSPPTHNFSLSKSQLKAELEKLKPQIEMKLESLYRDESDLAG
jgi:serine/threonine-protein kinase